MGDPTLGRSGESNIVGRMLQQAAVKEAASTGQTALAVILERTRERAKETMTSSQLADPGPQDREALRQLAIEEVRRYTSAATALGKAQLDGTEEETASRIVDEIAGLGALETLLADEQVEDIYILGPETVHLVYADGRRVESDFAFPDRERLMTIVRRALARDNKRVDFANPFADARLPDGSRLNVAIHPCAEPWPQIVIRKHRQLFETGEDRLARLIEYGTLTPQAALLLKLAIKAKASILVTGATAAGKTTVINALSSEFNPMDAVVTIEDTRELDFPIRNTSYLTTRLESAEGQGEISQRFLVRQALRKRPDWIVLGEARGAEAWDFVQGGNTGHAIIGSVHANSARDAIERFRDLSLEAGKNLEEHVVMRGVVRAFRLVLYVEMDPHLNRRVVKAISDVTGNLTEDNIPVLVNLFEWKGTQLQFTNNRPYPHLKALLDRVGGYEQVRQGTDIPPAWLEAAQKTAGGK